LKEKTARNSFRYEGRSGKRGCQGGNNSKRWTLSSRAGVRQVKVKKSEARRGPRGAHLIGRGGGPHGGGGENLATQKKLRVGAGVGFGEGKNAKRSEQAQRWLEGGITAKTMGTKITFVA